MYTFMDKKLLNAYMQTDYIIDDDIGIWLINIGQTERTLSRYLHRFKQPTAAFITAYNPHSKVVSKQQNELRHKALVAELNAKQLDFLNGYGAGRDESWSAEKSVFITNITQQQANQLAAKFEQQAYVWLDEQGQVSLITNEHY